MALGIKLNAIFKTRQKQTGLYKSDKTTQYGYVAQVMGEIRAAGIKNISLVTLPK